MSKKLLVYPPLFVLFWVMTAWGAKMYPPVEPPDSIYYDKFLWVKFQDDLDIGLSVEGLPIDRSGGGLSGPQGQAVMEYIQSQGGRWERMIAVSEARADEWRSRAAFNGKSTADLNTYFHLWVGEEASAQDWLEQLADLPEVAKLGRVPIPSLPTPPRYDSLQRYMTVVYPEDTAYSTAKSIEADYAWQFLGGHGQGVTICDIEVDWNLDHADLPTNIPTWVPSGYCSYHDAAQGSSRHGTANLGILGSRGNGFGTLGIARSSRLTTATSHLGQPGSCGNDFMIGTVLSMVIDSLQAGDVILLELQTAVEDSLVAYAAQLPIEVYPPAYDLIRTAVGCGIHVVEAAGNGGHNLGSESVDTDSIFRIPANWSGAIIVGAGVPGPGVFDTLQTGGQPPYVESAYYDGLAARSSGPFYTNWRSCYGPADTGNSYRRVDVQAWGDLVAAPGYPEYYTADGLNYYYTRWYGGTSSASPIVAGAVALIEGLWEKRFGTTMPPDSMRQLLRNTGLPQQGSDSLTHPIGPLVNVRLAIVGAFDSLVPCCSGKRGNVNSDPANVVDLSDLSMLINYVDDSCSVDLLCPTAADLNGSGTINDSDVTVMIQYLIYHVDNRGSCSLDQDIRDTCQKGVVYAVREDNVRCPAGFRVG